MAATGCLVALGALSVSYAAYRLQRQQAARLTERERALDARERTADERDSLRHASRVLAMFRRGESRLQGVEGQWFFLVYNGSGQPLRDVVASYDGVQLVFSVDTEHVSPRLTRVAVVPSALFRSRPRHAVTLLDFTDAADLRWRRSGNGSLQRGRELPDGSYEWGPKQAPLIEALPVGALDVSRLDAIIHGSDDWTAG